MTEQELNTKIFTKLDSCKPLPKWYFQVLWLVSAFVLFAILGLGIFSITFFLWDFRLILSGLPPHPSSVLKLIKLGLFEFLCFGILGSILVWWIYRKSDLPFVKSPVSLIILIILFVLGLSFGMSLAVQNFPPVRRYFNVLERKIDKFPNRQGRFKQLPPPPLEFRDFME